MFDDTQNDNIDNERKTMEYLILNGALEVAGIDSATGELLYSFTPKIKDVMPELYREHLNFVNEELMALWEKGFLNIDFFAEDPVVTIIEKALDPKEISKLSKQDQWSIEEFKRLMLKKEL